jgi:pimeloyl-ACP methyl ester carboxylesterase
MRKREIVLHGHRVSYRTAGTGASVILLIHGIAGCATQWDPAARILAEHYTVVAPDLLGHGESAKPRGDYSLGTYAASVRDLLVALGHRRATVVGHSLGGGVAMQFAYEYRLSPSAWCSSRAEVLAARSTPSCAPQHCRALNTYSRGLRTSACSEPPP